jgi:hypothetical protein
LKLPMSPSREFVSRALVSSRKQTSTANFWISLNLCVFFCMWFLFCIFSLLRVQIFLICSLIFPVWRRSMEALLDFYPFLVKWMHCVAIARWIQIIRRLFFASEYSKRFSNRTAKGCVNFDSGSIAMKQVIRNFVIAF